MVLAADAFRLDGKFAIVTGAAKGLGEAIALAYANYGADLAICDRDVENMERVAGEIRAMGRTCITSALDVRDTAAVDAWVGSLPDIDILVNNAGGTFYAWFMDVMLMIDPPRGIFGTHERTKLVTLVKFSSMIDR